MRHGIALPWNRDDRETHMRYHRGSQFNGPMRPLDRNEVARLIWRVEADAIASRKKHCQPWLTGCYARVLRTLLTCFLGANGRCDPSHATLARKSGVSIATVKRALAELKKRGVLAWTRRIARHGIFVRQISNAYLACRSWGGAVAQTAREGPRTSKKEEGGLAVGTAAVDILARIQRAAALPVPS